MHTHELHRKTVLKKGQAVSCFILVSSSVTRECFDFSFLRLMLNSWRASREASGNLKSARECYGNIKDN